MGSGTAGVETEESYLESKSAGGWGGWTTVVGLRELLPRAMAKSLPEPSRVRKVAKNLRKGQQAAILRIRESCFAQAAEIPLGRKEGSWTELCGVSLELEALLPCHSFL